LILLSVFSLLHQLFAQFSANAEQQQIDALKADIDILRAEIAQLKIHRESYARQLFELGKTALNGAGISKLYQIDPKQSSSGSFQLLIEDRDWRNEMVTPTFADFNLGVSVTRSSLKLCLRKNSKLAVNSLCQ
jgi:hypothetical protein